MKALLTFLSITVFVCSATTQNIPIDFEDNGNGADWTWTVFENDVNPPLEIIENPDKSGINTSATVAKFTALPGGQPFAGCESLHGADIGDFVINESNAIIRIMVWKSVISDVGIKLVRADNWSLGEIKISNTVVNAWEQIEFDFSDHIGNPYDQIVIFPDFKDRQEEHVIYFDNVYGEVASATHTNTITDYDVQLYPNPASDRMHIRSDDTFSDFAIYSISGELVEYTTDQNNTSFDISNLANGIYIFKAIHEDALYIQKFIKE